jgi:hypothetical protein
LHYQQPLVHSSTPWTQRPPHQRTLITTPHPSKTCISFIFWTQRDILALAFSV